MGHNYAELHLIRTKTPAKHLQEAHIVTRQEQHLLYFRSRNCKASRERCQLPNVMKYKLSGKKFLKQKPNKRAHM
jgi:hypothetical protein